MKINPVSIQSYQQISRRDNTSPTQRQNEEAAAKNVVIEPQQNQDGSNLSVKAPEGTYAQYLSQAESQALDMLFAKYRDGGRFGAGYAAEPNSPESQATVGRVIDVKV